MCRFSRFGSRPSPSRLLPFDPAEAPQPGTFAQRLLKGRTTPSGGPLSGRGRSAAFHLLLLLGFVALVARSSPAPAAAVGDSAPPLALHTASGQPFRLQDELRDHPVLLAFVSARCKPCEDSHPALEKLSRDFGSRHRLSLISIFFGLEKLTSSSEEETGSWADTLLLGDDATARAYGVFGTPVFLLVGKEGRVLWRHAGRLFPGDLEPTLEASLVGSVALAP